MEGFEQRGVTLFKVRQRCELHRGLVQITAVRFSDYRLMVFSTCSVRVRMLSANLALQLALGSRRLQTCIDSCLVLNDVAFIPTLGRLSCRPWPGCRR